MTTTASAPPADDEVVEAFKAIWTTGSTNEDWVAWVDHLTPDVEYVERVFGTHERPGRGPGSGSPR